MAATRRRYKRTADKLPLGKFANEYVLMSGLGQERTFGDTTRKVCSWV